MTILKFTLLICTMAGCWQQPSWTLSLKYIIYIFYSMILILALCLFSISEFMYIILKAETSDDFTSSIYMLLTIFVAACKQIYMWVNRKNVMEMVNALSERSFVPCESREVVIQEKFRKIVRKHTTRYLIIVMMSVSLILTTSFLSNLMKKNLTYKAWIPFDYSSSVVFYIVYAHQLLAMATSGVVNIAYDSLLCAFLLYICCQLEILEHRFMKMAYGEYSLRDCVIHHDSIFEYANFVNNKFAGIIAIQFIASGFIICSNLYRLNMAIAESDYAIISMLIIYTCAILMQIFLYCWFGNELKLKSLYLAEKIYDIEWRPLTISSKKALLLIINRARIPIEFKSMSLITMNLESFVGLLKLSYSAFSVLHQTQ